MKIHNGKLLFRAGALALALNSGVLLAQEQQTPQNLLRGGVLQSVENGVPAGWSLYGKKGAGTLSIQNGNLLLEDSSSSGEVGMTQTVPAQGGQTYGVRVTAREVSPGSTAGAFLQLRFLPSNKFHQIGLDEAEADEWNAGDWSTFVVSGMAPEGTKSVQVYVYSHAEPTPKMLVRQVELVPGLVAKNGFAEPVVPQYTQLKKLYLNTELVRDGKANATIAVSNNPRYRAAAETLRKAIAARTGVTLPIVADTQIKVPLEGNVILLGNRSTNAAIRTLYDRFFSLTDLKYPGAGGHEVRSVHNPFGNGFNAILVGGSDDAGVTSGAGVLAARLRAATGGQGALSVGHLMEIKLGAGVTPPRELKDFQIWEASKGYNSSGYFGWNSISKRLAMYYMTGDAFHAREALRLAFPDEKIKEELARVDGEFFENKDDPLAGTYHYNSTHMILFWDLVEESPIFTDAERLKVFNAFARQLKHRFEEDGSIYSLRRPGVTIGSRHGMYGALSWFVLARYFHRDDPESPVWRQAWRGANYYFAPLAKPRPWVFGENDNLFWFSTSTAPILTYMMLSGDHRALESGSLAELLRTQETLFNGRRNDRNLAYAALDYLNKTAAITGDGRWIAYRERTGLDTDVFRLGQSFWPDPDMKASEPTDLLNRWMVAQLPPDYAAVRRTGFVPEQSFMNASFRSATDGSSDYLLVDGVNGSGRNPYHTFAVLEMRLNGQTVLQGYNNQVQTKADGMVEPVVAMDAALLHRDVVGQTATLTASVPRAAFSNWTRSIAQRTGRYALVVDDLQFRTDSENFEAQFLWQRAATGWSTEGGGSRLVQSGSGRWKSGAPTIQALDAKYYFAPETISVANLSVYETALLRSQGAGAWLEMPFEVKQNFRGKVWARLLDHHDRGIVKFSLDGKPVGAPHDSYSLETQWKEVDLGTHELAPGTHRLRMEVTGKNPQSRNFFAGLIGVALEASGAAAVGGKGPQIVSADALAATIKDDTATQVWEGKAQNGARKKFFSLVGQGSAAQPLQARRLSESAAALRLPEPAIAVAGDYNNTIGDLVILAADHAYGKNSASVGAGSTLLRASHPVDFDWDFKTGALHLVSAQAAEISLALEPNAKLTRDGKALGSTFAGGLAKFNVPAGRHLIASARPDAGVLAALQKELAQFEVAPAAAPRDNGGSTPAAKLKTVFDAKVNGEIAASVIARDGSSTRLFAASGNSITEFDGAGKTVRELKTDGPIRVLHWWPQHKLLLAGCTDEKVIAFDAAGNRKWTFVSEMAPEVFRAAKQYWFKTAPGHNGIHGLDSGVFLDGKSQLFVGSACTLEILDENGKLVKRLPQFWGTVAYFKIVPAANDSLNLLAARSITEHPNLGVINNKTLNPSPRSFRDVPVGVTPVTGWTDQARFHIFHEDVDGDGQKEVISEITGAWNRVTVWDETGKAKYNVQFGPGENVYGGGMNRIGVAPIRDIDIADIDGDAKPEIVVALANGLIVALDGQCRKKWSRKLENAPSALEIIDGKIAVGCENGDVQLLDGNGSTLRRENIGARVNTLQEFSPSQLLASGAGGVVRVFDVR